jgi:hypothetical protein
MPLQARLLPQTVPDNKFYMRYYLETNALRALGKYLVSNPAVLTNAFTSTFSLFELIKRIGRGGDSDKRAAILKALWDADVSVRMPMPAELLYLAYGWQTAEPDSLEIYKTLISLIERNEDPVAFEEQLTNERYRKIVAHHEDGTLRFQKEISDRYVRPKPEPEVIKLDFAAFIEPDNIATAQTKHLDTRHPAYVFLEKIRDDQAVSTYRNLDVPDAGELTNAEIISRYNRELDLFFFATYAFELKKKAFREACAKNDMLDLLHTLYLSDNDVVMVSDDNIFESVLPNRNLISVKCFKEIHSNSTGGSTTH